MWQLIARGVVGYAPLVGTPPPALLHEEDTAFLLLVLSCLGSRSSVQRMSMTAPRSIGGLQLASVVECVVASVASELLFLLNGTTLASQLARDSLRAAMVCDLASPDIGLGLVSLAMDFLAGYGIYVSLATDKLVCRILDYLATRHNVKCHPLVGRFNAQWLAQSKKYCRIGSIANTIRLAIRHLVSRRIPVSRWIHKSTWSHAMPNNNYISDALYRDAYAAAASQKHIDWPTECQMFGVSTT